MWPTKLHSHNGLMPTQLSFQVPATSSFLEGGLPLIPAVHEVHYDASSNGFNLPDVLQIIVDSQFATSTQDDGLSLIPPTLLSFAETFAQDIRELFPSSSVHVSTTNPSRSILGSIKNYVYMSFSPDVNSTLASGHPTTEGYHMNISSNGVEILASGVKGAFWATRTLLQGFVLTDGYFPAAVINDMPDWKTRGIMLDVGRQWYPASFLKEICAYASWFKMSEFHLHLSDNVNPRGHPGAYARFRLRSDNQALAGLFPYVNETYSRSDFEDIQKSCAARGITIIPEIESPGHALAITQWKPHLALLDDPTLINLTVPDAIPTIKSIWKEFLPWFHTKHVSIGADEYDSDLADEYNNFVNTMAEFIHDTSGKTIRIWSTDEPSNLTAVSKKVIKQHWSFGEGDPYELIRQGYDVINSEDTVQYIVMKQPQPDQFPQRLNQTRLWQGTNTATGGIWDPHVFNRGNTSDNPDLSEDHLLGSVMAVWNDHGPNASTYLEAFYSIREGLPVVAAANWQAASRKNHLTHQKYLQGFDILQHTAPGQNLHRRIPTRGRVVVEYQISEFESGVIPDRSGNGYDARLERGIIHTPLGSKGHNYTLLLSVVAAQAQVVLLTGPDTSFGIVPHGGGYTLAFTSSNITYPLSNYTLPIVSNLHIWDITLAGTEHGSYVWVDGKYVGEFMIAVDGTTSLEPMAFVAPVQRIRGDGIQKVILWDVLLNESKATGLN